MRITAIAVLTSLMFTLGCAGKSSEEAPSRQSDKVEFMYSIDGIVNRDYCNSMQYAQTWRDGYYQSLKESGYDYSSDIRIEIPDSVSESVFKIKQGYYVAAFDSSRLMFTDQIAGFYSKVYEGSGEALPYFRLRENEKAGELNIIVKSRHDLQLVSDKAMSSDLNATERQLVDEKIIAYFDSRRRELLEQISPGGEVDTGLAGQDSKQVLEERFDFDHLRAEVNGDSEDDYIVVGTEMERPYLSFTAIVLGGASEVLMKTHSRFNQAVEIADRPHLLLFEYKPFTGLKGQFLYRIDGNELIEVFADMSYAD